MNLIDIETYTRKAIPTVSISNELLVKPNPPVKMKGGRLKPSGGKNSQRPGNRPGNRPGSGRGAPRRRHQQNKKAV